MTTPPPSFTVHPSLAPWNVPEATYIATDPFSGIKIDGVGTSVLVFSPSPSSPSPSLTTTSSNPTGTTPRILLLRRSPADSMPNLWETPGGGADPADPTILSAAARELLEEAGLVATSFLRVVPHPHQHPDSSSSSESPTATVLLRNDSWFWNRTRTLRWGKICLLATVDDDALGGAGGVIGGVRIDPKEHTDAFWASEDEVVKKVREDTGEALEFTPNYSAILEGFRVWRDIVAEGQNASEV